MEKIEKLGIAPQSAALDAQETKFKARYLEACDLFSKLKFKKAIPLFENIANEGYAEAQYFLGDCYIDGLGVKKDLTKAAEWLRKAAEQGHDKAKNALNRLRSAGAVAC